MHNEAAEPTEQDNDAQPEADAARPATAVLTSALRRARAQNAERADAVGDLRGAELGRLELLRERLAPVFAAVPADCDLFDPGLAPGERPRLFIDMLGFIEMDRDRRTFRFFQDTRHGRNLIGATDDAERMTTMVADYVAHRLVEREKALASDMLYRAHKPDEDARAPLPRIEQSRADEDFARRLHNVAPRSQAPRPIAQDALPATPAARPRGGVFTFIIEALGSAVLFGGFVGAALWLWRHYGPQALAAFQSLQ